MSTVIGLFEHDQDLRSSVRKLQQLGVPADEINVLEQKADVEKLVARPQRHIIARCVGCGALLGVGTFGVMSVVRISCQCFSMPLGPAFQVYTVILFILLGAVLGAIFGAYIGADAQERDTQLYTEGVCCGYTMIAIKTGGDRVARAMGLLRDDHAVGVKTITDPEEK